MTTPSKIPNRSYISKEEGSISFTNNPIKNPPHKSDKPVVVCWNSLEKKSAKAPPILILQKRYPPSIMAFNYVIPPPSSS